ncbi:hypothetical protein SRABI26_01313 [Arthrobacter sp. Bi26]|nr:hypothetical protein SRABI26_01313 [Arthrobacter sp. Bi26]
MMPAINHPRLSTPHAPKAARPGTAPAHPAAAMHHPGTALHSSLGHRDIHPATLADSDYVASPFCEHCGTDEFIYLETFVPATHRRDGSVSKLGEVTYFCSGCDDFSAHAVPASWAPPGWYFG